MDSITTQQDLEIICEGPQAVAMYHAIMLAQALEFYAESGCRINRSYTPRKMMATAHAITGQRFKARDYRGAAAALRAHAADIRRLLVLEREYSAHEAIYGRPL